MLTVNWHLLSCADRLEASRTAMTTIDKVFFMSCVFCRFENAKVEIIFQTACFEVKKAGQTHENFQNYYSINKFGGVINR